MTHAPTARLALAHVVRRAEARRAGLVAALSLAAAEPALAQGPVPQGGEFRVNTEVAGYQGTPRVAAGADGSTAVVWTSGHLDGQGDAFVRRYSPAGAPLGPEVRVNTYTAGLQGVPAVAVGPDGGLVVVWESEGQDGSDYGIYGQRYSASGETRGPEFRVNTYTSRVQRNAVVASDADGDFVVTWASGTTSGPTQDGEAYGIYAQRYASSGDRLGSEFRVNTTAVGDQEHASVAMDADGDFVIVWTDDQGAGQIEVRGQRYDRAGVPRGGEFQANTDTASFQNYPSVAMAPGGDFVTAWQSRGGQDGDGDGVFAQRYTSEGARAGGEFQINELTAGDQSHPSVALDAAGGFVVAWQSEIVGDGTYTASARRFTAAGAPDGGEFQVNTYPAGFPQYVSAALDADGDLTVVWESFEQDGSGIGVFGQRFSGGTVAAEPGVLPVLALTVAPNPVGTSGGRVRYVLPAPQHVRLTVADALGREVAVLTDGEQGAGPHEARFDAARLGSGVYVVRLDAGTETTVRRVAVVR